MDLFTSRSERLMKAWDESKHPRDERGRWTAGGGPTGRFTSTGEGLALPSAGRSMLSALRSVAEPLRYKHSDEG
jgi:hypothetical protein